MLKLEAGIKPWILCEEFNLVRNLDKKKGGIRKLNPISEYFNEVIANLELVDVRMTNGTFTWNNKTTRDRGITYRLYWFLVYESIMKAGGELSVVVLPSGDSNHWPIDLDWESVGVNLGIPFRLEKLWLLQANFPEKLKEWWEEMPPIKESRMHQFQQKLKLLKNNIKKWNKESFGNIFQAKKELDSKIQEVQIKGM